MDSIEENYAGEGQSRLQPGLLTNQLPGTEGSGGDVNLTPQLLLTTDKQTTLGLSIEDTGTLAESGRSIVDGKSLSEAIHSGKKNLPARRNAVTEVEAGLSRNRIKHLAEIFKEADTSGTGFLNMEQFRNCLRQIVPYAIPESEMDLIFMKTDVNCDGKVDWGEYLTFIMLECKERDRMAIMEQQCFQKSPRFIKSDRTHKDSVVSLLHQRLDNTKDKTSFTCRYVSISRDGVTIFWNSAFKMSYSHRIESSKTVWVTDTCIMPNVNMIVVATTARAVSFYDITGNRFVELSRIIALEACPTCCYYWYSPVDAECSVLLLGDDHGGVTVIAFKACPLTTDINPKRIGIKGQVDRIHIGSIIKGTIPHIRACSLDNVHKDLVRQVMYLSHLGCFVSCCKNANTALCLANIDLELQRKVVPTYFHVTQGINTFDYCKHLNMIVTGGYDALIRVWNPYISSRPSSLLYGHQSPVLFVRINSKKELVVSVSEIKEIRIHDLNSQTCIQKFYKKMFPELEPRSISACLFNPVREDLIIATTEIAILEGRENELRDPQSMSHLKPVTRVIYNPLFHQVVSASWDALVCVWNLVTGVKQMQFRAYKVRQCTYDREITAMSFDPTYRRLITSGKTGSLRIWNFNNGELLYTMPNLEMMEISCILWNKQRIITGGWSQRIAIYLETKDNYMVHLLKPSHKGDVTSLACYRGTIVASACFDGDVYVWYLETGRLLSVVNACITTERPLSPKEHTGHHAPNPSIYYANSLKKNPHVVEDLTPLPCYLRKNSSLDINQVLNSYASPSGDSNSSLHGMEDPEEPRKAYSKSTPQPTEKPKSPNNGIEKMVFLENRENTQDNATLLCAKTNGVIMAWSLHPRGGLKGSFHASCDKTEPVTAMVYVQKLELLLTGDARGYIRVWDINHFAIANRECNMECLGRWSHFTFMKWKMMIRRKGIYHGLFPLQKSDHPHLITSLRGHLTAVTSFDVILAVPGEELMLTSSLDCSVRLWRLSGECLGVYNQSHYWNVKHMDLPVWKEDGSIDQDGSQLESLSIKRKRKVMIPRDIQRVASATSIHVMMAGRKDLWSKVRNIIKQIVAYRRRSRAPSRSLTKDSVMRLGTAFESLLEPERKELDIQALLAEAEQKKQLTIQTKILGMSYKKKVNHRPLPKLYLPPAMEPQCSAYRALPYYDLDPLTNPMSMPELRTIRKTHKLPAISQSKYYGYSTVAQKANQTVKIANLAQILTQGGKRKLSTQLAPKEPEAKGPSSQRSKGKTALMGAVALIGLHRKLHFSNEPQESEEEQATPDDKDAVSPISLGSEVAELSQDLSELSPVSDMDSTKGSAFTDSLDQDLGYSKARRNTATPVSLMPVMEEYGDL